MTTNDQLQNTRDEVLFAFQEACDRPTAEQIIEWTTRYPQFADDIRAHAAVARDWDAQKCEVVEKADETMLARGYSLMLNAIYEAGVREDAVGSTASCESFQEMMARCGTDVPKLARELDIGRSVLADLVNGGVLPPIGQRFVREFTAALKVAAEKFDAALQYALGKPQMSNAKSKSTPVVIPRPFRDVIANSNMSPERIKYWLAEE